MALRNGQLHRTRDYRPGMCQPSHNQAAGGLTQIQLNVEREGLWITFSRDLYDVVGEKQAPRVT